MTADRHLGSAWIDKCRPDLLISESTYATTIRDSKRCRERDLLKKVHDTVDKGGKVQNPVWYFACKYIQMMMMMMIATVIWIGHNKGMDLKTDCDAQ